MPNVTGKKKVEPPDKKHWQNFNDALEDALKNADDDPQWRKGISNVTVQLQATVEIRSPGNIHEYRVILTQS